MVTSYSSLVSWIVTWTTLNRSSVDVSVVFSVSILGNGMVLILILKCLELSGLERLDDRRMKTLRNFAHKTSQNERYSSTWFPLNDETDYNLRHREKYKVSFARQERLRKAPIHAMRRILNDDEEGLVMAERNPDRVGEEEVTD